MRAYCVGKAQVMLLWWYFDNQMHIVLIGYILCRLGTQYVTLVVIYYCHVLYGAYATFLLE